MNPTEDKILDALPTRPPGVTVPGVIARTGIESRVVRTHLRALLRSGRILATQPTGATEHEALNIRPRYWKPEEEHDG